MKSPKKVIIDVDVGVDDYFAILLLLNAEKHGNIKIEAIFCTAGNTSLNNVCKNVMRLLKTVNRLDIPVYKGATERLIPTKEKLQYFHGLDGFGDLEYQEEPDLSLIRTTPSAIALRNIVINNANEINLICVGPLTNLALSIKLYDDLIDNLKDIWLMGGNYAGVEAEFNFKADAEAAHIVFEAVKKPVYMLPWETCEKSGISFDWRLKVLRDDTEALKLLTKAEIKCYDINKDPWMTCDAYVVFAFLNPDKNILETHSHSIKINLDGQQKGAVLICDDNRPPNVVVIQEINVELFKEAALEIKNL